MMQRLFLQQLVTASTIFALVLILSHSSAFGQTAFRDSDLLASGFPQQHSIEGTKSDFGGFFSKSIKKEARHTESVFSKLKTQSASVPDQYGNWTVILLASVSVMVVAKLAFLGVVIGRNRKSRGSRSRKGYSVVGRYAS